MAYCSQIFYNFSISLYIYNSVEAAQHTPQREGNKKGGIFAPPAF